MEFLISLLCITAIISIINCFLIYKPSLDLVQEGKKYSLLLWYNKWDDYNGVNRKYIVILKF